MTEDCANKNREEKFSRPLKVAFICDDLMIGGWSSLVRTIANFTPDKVIPLVICLFGKGENAEYLENLGIRVRCLYFKRYNLIWKLLILSVFLRKEKVDIVHSQLVLSHLIGQTAALLAGIKYRIMHVHDITGKLPGLSGKWLGFLVNGCSVVISVSKAVEQSFRKTFPHFRGKNIVIHNGINISEIQRRMEKSGYNRMDFGIPGEAFTILTVGNLKWEKGHKYLIEAAGLLNDPSIHFLIVGDGPEKNALNGLIEEKQLQNQFHFLGKRMDVSEILKVADIFVMPSVSEGLGISILEAFAGGLPVVSTNIHGISEIAVNEENALLLDPADPGKLVEGIRRLREDCAFRRRIAESAQKWVERFDIKNTIPKYEAVYQELFNPWK